MFLQFMKDNKRIKFLLKNCICVMKVFQISFIIQGVSKLVLQTKGLYCSLGKKERISLCITESFSFRLLADCLLYMVFTLNLYFLNGVTKSNKDLINNLLGRYFFKQI